MLVEPLTAGDDLAANSGEPDGGDELRGVDVPVRPASLSQPVGLSLGSQAGESQLRAVLAEAGTATSAG